MTSGKTKLWEELIPEPCEIIKDSELSLKTVGSLKGAV